ncbi:MAG: aromatic amino acid transport family protein [Chlamydiota bacterium]
MDEIRDSLFEEEESDKSLLGAVFLISGTCIGAGMLALPFVTSLSGFYPSLLIGTLCWLFMMVTGLLFLEATLWLPDGANVLSITKRFLGRGGELVAGVTFLFLYYCLLVSYMDEGTPLLKNILTQITGLEIPNGYDSLLFTFIFGLMVLWGTKLVTHINWFLVAGLIISYMYLISAGNKNVTSENIEASRWGLWLFAAPTLFSAYGYHNIIPTLSTYMKRDAPKLRLAIIFGTTLPFIVYSLWQWMVIGSVPSNELAQATSGELRSFEILESVTHNPWIGVVGGAFAFFALVTSLLGVSLSMVDFLGDGFGVKRSGITRAWLCSLVFIPPMIITFYNPGIFITAIGIAGGFGEAILNGIIPIAMFWIGKYTLRLDTKLWIPGGRVTLALLLLATLFIMCLEAYHLLFFA